MLSAVNDVPASPTAAGFQVNSGSVVNAEAVEQATAIAAAAKIERLHTGDWKCWYFMACLETEEVFDRPTYSRNVVPLVPVVKRLPHFREDDRSFGLDHPTVFWARSLGLLSKTVRT